MDRRQFLGMAGAAGILAPGAAAASPKSRVEQLRELWAATRDGALTDLPGGGAEELALAEGLGAFRTLKELERTPIEDQVHPAFQALIVDVAEALGRCLCTTRALVDGWLQAPAAKEPWLREAIGTLAARLGSTDGIGASAEGGLRSALKELEAPGALHGQLTRHARRLGRAEELARELHSRWDETGVLAVHDPEILRRVEAGRRAAEEAGEAGGAPAHSRSFYVAMAALVFTIGIAGGAFVVYVGVCFAACGAPGAGFLTIFAGLAIIGVSIWGGIQLVRAAKTAAPGG